MRRIAEVRRTLNPVNWRPTVRWAVALILLAVAGIAVYADGGLQAWMPNIVVGATTVAITITLIDRAIRSEARLAAKPRLDDALDAIKYPFKGLLLGLAFDYGQTHTHTSELPHEPLALLDFWLVQERGRDRDRRLTPDIPSTMLMYEAAHLSETLLQYRGRYPDVFEPDFLLAIDRFIDAEGNAAPVCDLVLRGLPDPQTALADAHLGIVRAARSLAAHYIEARPEWSPVDVYVEGAAEVGNSQEP